MNFGFGKAADFNELAGARAARDNSNAVAGYAKRFGDRPFDCRIGLALLGRRRHSHFQRVAKPSRDAIPR